LNVFAGFFNNFLFIFVLLLTFAVQFALVQIGGNKVKCAPLDYNQHLLCMSIGALSLPWGFILKFMPLRLFQCISIDDAPMDPEQLEQTLSMSLKRSSTMQRKKKL